MLSSLSLSSSIAISQTRLADAIESKKWEDAQQLIERVKDINATQPDGMTALHWAVHHQHEATVARLIASGADANSQNRYSVSPLAIAASLGSPNIVESLLSAGAKVSEELPGKVTPLMLAARTGNAKNISLLLEHGADINATERSRQTAIMWAAAEGNVESVDVLINAGADLHKTTKAGFSAMTFAAREGHLDVVARLLEAGVDVNEPMKPENSGSRVPRKGTSALTMAVESGHFELAMYLIDHGADPNDQRSGYAPLHILSWVRKPNRGEDPSGDPSPRGSGSLTSIEFVRALVEAGADVNLRLKKGKSGKAVLNRQGATPFLLAANTADLPYLKLLLELGADPTIPNVDECTALMAAAGIGVRAVGEEAGTEPEVLEVAEWLLDLGFDVNAVDKNKETAVHGAAYRCFPKVIKLLADAGAKPSEWNHKNKYGWTPILIGKGHRPGSFKPDPPTVDALKAAMASNR